MDIFLIALTENGDQAISKLQRAWPGKFHEISSDLLMLCPESATATAATISKQMDIGVAAEQPSGLVLKIDPKEISGTLPSAAVDWYRKASEQ